MYNKIAIVRKIDDGMAAPVNELASTIHDYGHHRELPVFDHHWGTTLPDGARNVLFVSLGGDGTLLYAADLSMKYVDSGVVGFNLGNLGFLTEDVDRSGVASGGAHAGFIDGVASNLVIFDFLDGIINNDLDVVKSDPRMMLDIRIGDQQHFAMNEVTLYTSLRNFMTTTVAVNKMMVGKFGGNGVAVTTATGSTALGLSAGGAIISPNTNIMQIVPLLPHKVAKQPIITSGRDEVILRAETSARTKRLYALADSRQVLELDYDKDERFVEIIVKRAKQDVTLWRPKNWNFFNVLSNKMMWSA